MEPMYPNHDEGESFLHLEAPLPLYIIHLAPDIDRERRLLTALSALGPEVAPEFVSAVDGQTLARETCLELTGDPRWAQNRGTIACFLSHAHAWSRVAEGRDDHALVVEDDVDLDSVGMIRAFDIPQDADLVFVNERMAPTPEIWPHLGAIRPIRDVLTHLERTRHMGADGYLLSKRGAEILCDACRHDGYYGHVDGRLLRYCTSATDLSSMGETSWIAGIITHHHSPRRPPRMGILKGYSLWPSVVSHAPAGTWDSTRARIDRAMDSHPDPLDGARAVSPLPARCLGSQPSSVLATNHFGPSGTGSRPPWDRDPTRS